MCSSDLLAEFGQEPKEEGGSEQLRTVSSPEIVGDLGKNGVDFGKEDEFVEEVDVKGGLVEFTVDVV